MRKVIGMGETILDILFKDGQPVAAVPGGSSFNAIISVGRAGFPCHFVGCAGNDQVGQIIHNFMVENGVSTDYFELSEKKSAISLAFLDKAGDAHYSFYKPSIQTSCEKCRPSFQANDVLLYGSYYACSRAMQPFVQDVLEEASQAESILYYDLNFRKSHAHELADLLPTIEENMRKSTIVRGSADDFEVMYGIRNAEQIYDEHISGHCAVFICTSGADNITVCTPSGRWSFATSPIEDVKSTVGAGDNFNAGFSCALIKYNIIKSSISKLTEKEWEKLISMATSFSAAACKTTENYIPKDFQIPL